MFQLEESMCIHTPGWWETFSHLRSLASQRSHQHWVSCLSPLELYSLLLPFQLVLLCLCLLAVVLWLGFWNHMMKQGQPEWRKRRVLNWVVEQRPFLDTRDEDVVRNGVLVTLLSGRATPMRQAWNALGSGE